MGEKSRTISARRAFVIAASTLIVVIVAGGLYWFQPWKLWTDMVVDETLPTIAGVASVRAPTSPASTATAQSVPRTGAAVQVTPAQAVLLADGELISHEHSTNGSVELIRLANGHRVLTMENLRTSNGPALHVWLTDAPVLAGSDGWSVFDDGLHVDLGDLKGNIGNQIYPVPDDVDLSRYSSVSIWCERFSVSFGAAELVPA